MCCAWYNCSMTAKQALLDYIETLPDEELESLWQRIQVEAEEYSNLAPPTEEQLASIRRGLAQSEAGLGMSHEDMLRRFNLR